VRWRDYSEGGTEVKVVGGGPVKPMSAEGCDRMGKRRGRDRYYSSVGSVFAPVQRYWRDLESKGGRKGILAGGGK